MQAYIGLTASYPLDQYFHRKKILSLLDECKAQGLEWPHRDSLVARLSRWDSLTLPELNEVLEELQGFRVRMQDINKFLARQAEKQAAQQKQARILAFPTSPEALQKITSRQVTQKKTASKAAPKSTKPKTGNLDKKRNTVAEEIRKSLLAKVHIAKKDLVRQLPEFSDDTYRFILEMKYDVSSAKDCSNEQLQGLLHHFQDMGWNPQPRNSVAAHPLVMHDPAGLGRDAQMRKIQALLAEKGTAEGKVVSLNYALSILKRQTGNTVTAFEDALPEHLRSVISALTRNAARQGRRAR